MPDANSSADTFKSERQVEVNALLQELKPEAGRIRRRIKAAIASPDYLEVNSDDVRVSPQCH